MVIQKDKIKHFTISTIISAILLIICISIKCETLCSILISSSLSILIGVIKEVYDYYSISGTADVYDLIADVLGVAFSTLVYIALLNIIL